MQEEMKCSKQSMDAHFLNTDTVAAPFGTRVYGARGESQAGILEWWLLLALRSSGSELKFLVKAC